MSKFPSLTRWTGKFPSSLAHWNEDISPQISQICQIKCPKCLLANVERTKTQILAFLDVQRCIFTENVFSKVTLWSYFTLSWFLLTPKKFSYHSTLALSHLSLDSILTYLFSTSLLWKADNKIRTNVVIQDNFLACMSKEL